MDGDTPWYRSPRGPPVVVGYAVVTLVVLAASTGWLLDGTSFHATAAVPLHVYLFGFLGGMTYAFTSLVAKFERGVTGVVRVGLRALAALPLAAGVYLLAGPLGLPVDAPRLAAGLAFLVGLYVNVTLKALGGLADRLFAPSDEGTDAPSGGGDAAVEAGNADERADGADQPEPGQPTSADD